MADASPPSSWRKKDSRVTPPCDGTVSAQWVGEVGTEGRTGAGHQGAPSISPPLRLLLTTGVGSVHKACGGVNGHAHSVPSSAHFSTPNIQGGISEDAIDSFQETKLQTLTENMTTHGNSSESQSPSLYMLTSSSLIIDPRQERNKRSPPVPPGSPLLF